MNYLGIDYGKKRIGLAIGNDLERLAMPLRTIENNAVDTRSGYVVPRTNFVEHPSTLKELKRITEDGKIDEIVVGVPISFDGKEHAQAKEARAFGESLKEFGLSVHFENEMLTSKQSRASGSTNIDASSAALILQSFLDRKLNK